MQPNARGGSPWSLRIATVAGIPVRLHFTFALFLALIGVLGAAAGGTMLVVFMILLFVCILLHEFGHALTAQRYGIKTRDITLYPIGGVAMLEGRPKPWQELWITLAGPAVNVVLALLFGGYLLATEGRLPVFSLSVRNLNLPQALFNANVILALFNLIPAFPMDGGRILRAILALRIGERDATKIAATVGQALAIVIGLVAIFSGQLMLMLVAFFVFLGAGQEAQSTVAVSILAGRRVKEAMITRLQYVENGWPLEAAARMLLEGSQQDFPVVGGSEIVGLLARNDIARGLAMGAGHDYVAAFMRRDFKRAAPDDDLESVVQQFSHQDGTPVMVFEGERFVGMLTAENLSEFLLLEQARAQGRSVTAGVR